MFDLIKIRQDLHQIPEKGFQEFKTQEYIRKLFADEPRLNLHSFDFTGLLYEYRPVAGDFKLFRADMDGLVVTEATGCEFSSLHHGMMHACGHDLHMTILIGLMDKVLETDLQQNLLFLFQPAEEGQGGAERIIKTGILNEFSIDSAYALHVLGSLPRFAVSSRPGIFFANAREVNVYFHGRSAHLAFASQGRNALEAGVDFYSAFQEKMKMVFPEPGRAICGFGKFQAGTVMNAVPAECCLEGSIRTFSDEDMDEIGEIIADLAASAGKRHGVTPEVIYRAYYRHVKNADRLVEKLERILAGSRIRFELAERVFTGEDFGFFTHLYPGLLFWLGADQGEKQDLHSDKFLPTPEIINDGLEVFWKLLEN